MLNEKIQTSVGSNTYPEYCIGLLGARDEASNTTKYLTTSYLWIMFQVNIFPEFLK